MFKDLPKKYDEQYKNDIYKKLGYYRDKIDRLITKIEEMKKAERTDHVWISEFGDIGTKSDIKEMRKVQKEIESMMALF